MEPTMQSALRHHQSAGTMDELRALNARFIHNFITRDVASHDAMLHPDFINIWPTGQRLDRASYLKYWATAFDPEVIVYWDVRDELITVIGDVAPDAGRRVCVRAGAVVQQLSVLDGAYQSRPQDARAALGHGRILLRRYEAQG